MKTFIKILTLGFVSSSFLLTSCDEDFPWDKEQYDKLIYVQSNTDKIYSVEYFYDGSQNERTLSFLCSGSEPTDRDVTITIEEDEILFDLYNKNNFDVDTEKYAKKLSPDRFTIPSESTVLKKGEHSAQLPIIIDKEGLKGLSPDSTYFIPLAIKSVSAYEINPEKMNLLFRVYARNAYASSKIRTEYYLKGVQTEPGKDPGAISLPDKHFVPLSENEVRMFVGLEPSKTDLESINKYSVKIKVNEDNSLTISPYFTEEGGLEIEPLTPPTDPEDPNILYDNTYDPASKRFKMYYKYKDPKKGIWYTMREIDALSTEID